MGRCAPGSKPPASPGMDLGGNAPSPRRSTRSARRSSRPATQASPISATSQPSMASLRSIYLSGGRPASPSPSRGSEVLSATIVGYWLSTSSDWLVRRKQESFSGRTSPVPCRRTEDGRLEPCSGGWKNSGMSGPIGRLTLDTSEAPTDAVESSLSDVLEDDTTLPRTLFLSLSTQSKILARLEKYGKPVPPEMGLPSCTGSPETRPPSSSGTPPLPCVPTRAEKGTWSGIPPTSGDAAAS